jgi:hypothetical protein
MKIRSIAELTNDSGRVGDLLREQCLMYFHSSGLISIYNHIPRLKPYVPC